VFVSARPFRATLFALLVSCAVVLSAAPAGASDVIGTVIDQARGVLPGVSVELKDPSNVARLAVTDAAGQFEFRDVAPGTAALSFSLVNFGTVRREVVVPPMGVVRADAIMQYVLSADVIVTGRRTFANLAEVDNPAENLVGIAQSASQGAITARQLDVRPLMRTGEVLETVPGIVVSQHSGEGKANQYYLRGFNLDHGTDFATTVAGMPVNMPTHGHGHGYSDLTFLIPELVTGIQYSKGPYFADQGDFATAGAANINYANVLDAPIVHVGGGSGRFARALVAGSRRARGGHLLGAFDVEHNDGPWVQPGDARKFNGVARYSRGDALNAFVLTGMAYRGTWSATDQVPLRAVEDGRLDRFGSVDTTDGGRSARYSASLEWQRTAGAGLTKITAFGMAYELDLFSNFTFFLDDPERGDQFHQTDRRIVSGVKASHRRLGRWAGRSVQNTVGTQIRNDAIRKVGLYRTVAREIVFPVRQDRVLQTSGAVYAQNEIEWTPWLRTLTGIRADRYRFAVDAQSDPATGGTTTAGIVSPKGGVVVGPFGRGTEFYANAGLGFHSNDARGALIVHDGQHGRRAERVTPLARATGAEVGLRTVAVPHLQSSVALWSLALDSELIFVGDAGTTEPGPASHRYGVEIANYYSANRWLTFDGDIAWSHAHFANAPPGGRTVPGAVQTVMSGGVTVDAVRRIFGSARLRYFGPRPLVEDNSVRSRPTTLVNAAAGYKATPRVRVTLDLFNILDAADSDIDYFYTSRLRGEPEGGIDDVHFHPMLPRTARLTLTVAF
jgi:outer membrane receptor protein involved in Fe transport